MTVIHRFGFNANDHSYGDKVLIPLLAHKVRASTHLIMNSPATAQRVWEAAEGESVIISRSNWPDDTSYIPVDDLMSNWSRERAKFPNVHWYFPNEPVVSDREDLKRLLGELITLMRKLDTAKIKAVIGNFAWGNILHLADVEAGVWDGFIRTASWWTNNGGGYIGGHDYTSGVLPFGAAKRNPYDMLEPALVQPSRWPTYGEVHDTLWRDNWLVLRWVMLAKRAEQLGVPMFKMIVTEAPWDRMPNLEKEVEVAPGVWRDGVVRLLDARLGYARGPLDQRKWFPYWWPQWTQEQAAIEQIRWLDEVYPDYVVGFTFFALNNDPQWLSYNFMDWPQFIDSLAVYRKEAKLVLDESRAFEYLFTPKGNYRVAFRSEPVVGDNVIGWFPIGEQTHVLHFPVDVDGNSTTKVVGDNSYVPVRWAGVMGWVAQNYLVWTAIEEQPAPDPDDFYRDTLAEVGNRLSTIAQDITNLLD